MSEKFFREVFKQRRGGGGGESPWSAGNTASRPTDAIPGEAYFDTDLQEQIVWTGTQWVSPSRAAITCAPFVDIIQEGWTFLEDSQGATTITHENMPRVFLREVPSSFLTDPALDARLELMRLTYLQKQGTGRHTVRWVHPHPVPGSAVFTSNDVFRNQLTQDGVLGERISEWSLLGASQQDFFRGDDMHLSTWWRVGQITVRDHVGALGITTANTAVASGYALRGHADFRPRPYRTRPLRQAFAWRYSIVDPRFNDPRTRLVGPMSAIVWGGPRHWPAYRTTTGLWAARDSLTVRWRHEAMAFSGRRQTI